MNGQPHLAPRLARRALALALGGVLALAASAAFGGDVRDRETSRAASTRRSRSACSGGCRGRAAASSATTTAAARRRPARWARWSTARDSATRRNPDFNYLQSDNGNLNYKKNQLVSSVLKGNHELALRFRDGWSALGRFSWLYDPAADNTERTPLSDDAKNIAVHNITLLDLWVAKDFELGDRPGKVKVGNQVLSWGEDIFIYGGINIINPIDLTRAHKPGVQLKEIFRPAPMASFNYRRDQQPFRRGLLAVPAGTRSGSTRWERISRAAT